MLHTSNIAHKNGRLRTKNRVNERSTGWNGLILLIRQYVYSMHYDVAAT